MIETQLLDPDDWRLWRQLRHAALREAPSAFGSTYGEWSGAGDTEERWRARLSQVPLNIVLRLDGAPVGMVSGLVRVDDVVELTSMWVAPAGRGKGIGDTAVRAVVDWAGERDVILSVKTGNEPAIRLYRRNGFVDVGPSPEDSGERLMRRRRASTRRP
ncbi:acetyltransferase (GNAT) family protein [Tamaricihabitans halophyticus]|uniref:Acetyltransferase (GNAT) family protein n=1 Tax=Tamaricihabitans halophyticus TaxID=1262583 RepID=A0A4V2STJ3_9PSEU|nr:GNAT family N-acetyltransferase [Tamaricihabitans halophyticus]TCP50976.1 acetyltransferase (GNAT) family protein [Tamaricihabitans halophyticus]